MQVNISYFQFLYNLHLSGSSTSLTSLSLSSLIPTTSEFITYEGSLTQPSCQESVTWIIPNKPIYITPELLDQLAKLMQVSQSEQNNGLISMTFKQFVLKDFSVSSCFDSEDSKIATNVLQSLKFSLWAGGGVSLPYFILSFSLF